MNEFTRYLVVGGLNTAVCYVIYLIALQFTSYNVAFTIDYIFGIFFSYFLQLRFVFKERGSLKKAATFPTIYIIQYLIGLAALNAAVSFNIPEELALLFAILVPIPIMYLLSRFVLKPAQ
jgi:putative flippase GtrA|tara:strand:- start:2685 stop:3044 length:360 start_codon:yes stop_codon:yes gene_type:complete